MRRKPVKTIKVMRVRRVRRTRAKIFGTAERPRLSVFRSNQQTYLQLINDEAGKTLVSASSLELKGKEKKSKVATAQAVAELLAKRARGAGIKEAVFDRRSYKYHGRVKAVGQGVRDEGLKI